MPSSTLGPIARALMIAVGLACVAVPRLFAASPPQRAVRVLQWKMHDGTFHPACTTWSTRVDARQAWVTAAHCVPSAQTAYAIDGRQATPFMWDPMRDLAALRGGPSAEPLLIAYGQAPIFTNVITLGCPFGHRTPHVTTGISSGQDKEGRSLFGLAVGSGMSGAPVLDARSYLVVGMILQAECESPGWCPFSSGAPAHALRRFLFNESP